MSTASGVMEQLGTISSGQWGLLTTSQAWQMGVTAQQLARLTRLGQLERVRHGVYRIASAPPEPQIELQASWLSLAPEQSVSQRMLGRPSAVVSHRSAAQLHRLGDLDVPRHEFRVVERRQSRDKIIRLHRSRTALEPEGWTVVGGLPVTTVCVTVADLAAAGIDGGHLASVVRDALTTAHVSVADLEAALAPAAHRYGAARHDGAELLAELLAQAGVDESSRRIGEILAGRQAKIAARRYGMTHRLGMSDDELQRLLSPLVELMNRSTSHHLDPAVQAISDVVAAQLAPIADGIAATMLTDFTPSVTRSLDAAVAPVLAAITDHVNTTVASRLAASTPALTAPARSSQSRSPAASASGTQPVADDAASTADDLVSVNSQPDERRPG